MLQNLVDQTDTMDFMWSIYDNKTIHFGWKSGKTFVDLHDTELQKNCISRHSKIRNSKGEYLITLKEEYFMVAGDAAVTAPRRSYEQTSCMCLGDGCFLKLIITGCKQWQEAHHRLDTSSTWLDRPGKRNEKTASPTFGGPSSVEGRASCQRQPWASVQRLLRIAHWLSYCKYRSK